MAELLEMFNKQEFFDMLDQAEKQRSGYGVFKRKSIVKSRAVILQIIVLCICLEEASKCYV